jgi:membrane protein
LSPLDRAETKAGVAHGGDGAGTAVRDPQPVSADVRAAARNEETVLKAGPEGPTDMGRRSWWATLRRTISEFREDNLTDWAAALTYYAVLSIFPALIALVSILGLAGNAGTITTLTDIVSDIGPKSAADTFKGPIETVINSKGGAGAALVISLAVALWTASGYVGAFTRASNTIYEVDEGRPFWRLRPLQMLLTLTCVLLLALVLIALVLTGPLAESVGKAVGIDDTAVTIWQFAKWPALLAVVITIFALLYYWAPNVKQPRFRWITPGSIAAVALWIVASAGFALYVANFGSYNKTYGSLAGVIVFLVWLWISNLAVLLGAELNAEVERSRELEAGLPAEREIQLPPRAEPKAD